MPIQIVSKASRSSFEVKILETQQEKRVWERLRCPSWEMVELVEEREERVAEDLRRFEVVSPRESGKSEE